MSTRLSIVLAEDHHLVRQAMKMLLEKEASLHLVGEAADGLQAMEMVEKLAPALLITDLNIPRLHGLDLVRRVRREHPHTRIIVLSMHSDDASVVEALRNGALGYVLKEATAAELLHAIRDVAAGRRYISRSLAERVLPLLNAIGPVKNGDSFDALTSRERHVLQLAAEGLTAAQIATKLFISPRTAETHRSNLMRKLGLSSQTDLVRLAIRKGLIPP